MTTGEEKKGQEGTLGHRWEQGGSPFSVPERHKLTGPCAAGRAQPCAPITSASGLEARTACGRHMQPFPVPQPPVLPQGKAPVPKACRRPSREQKDEDKGDEDATEQPQRLPQQLSVTMGHHEGGDSGDTPGSGPLAPAGCCPDPTVTHGSVPAVASDAVLDQHPAPSSAALGGLKGLCGLQGLCQQPTDSAVSPHTDPKPCPLLPTPFPGHKGTPMGCSSPCSHVGWDAPVPCQHPGEVTPQRHREGTAWVTPAAPAQLPEPPLSPAGSRGPAAATYLPARPRAARRSAWPGQGVSARVHFLHCCRWGTSPFKERPLPPPPTGAPGPSGEGSGERGRAPGPMSGAEPGRRK